MKLIIFLTLCIALGANAALIRGSGASGVEGAASAGAVNCSGLVGGNIPEECAGKVIPEPTWSPKLVVKSTNYMDVDPQDFAKVTREREIKENATLAKNLKNLMLEDRKSDCIGTGRDCNLDNHEEVDQDKPKREEMKSESDREEERVTKAKSGKTESRQAEVKKRCLKLKKKCLKLTKILKTRKRTL